MQSPGTASTRLSTAPSHHSPRFGMPVAPQNDQQPRSSMSEAMAVLAASGNAVGPGQYGGFVVLHQWLSFHWIQSINPEFYCREMYLVGVLLIVFHH